MKKKGELLISGNITKEEISELSKLFSDIEVHKLETKGLTPVEFLQIVFNDFEIVTFTRDFILGSVLTGTLDQIRKIIKYLKERNKKAKNISIEFQLKTENKTLMLNIVCEPNKLDLLIDLTNNEILSIIESADDNCLVHITWNTKRNEIEIQYL